MLSNEYNHESILNSDIFVRIPHQGDRRRKKYHGVIQKRQYHVDTDIFCQMCLDAIFGSADICRCGSYRQSDGAHEDAKPREGEEGNDIFVVVVKSADTKNEK